MRNTARLCWAAGLAMVVGGGCSSKNEPQRGVQAAPESPRSEAQPIGPNEPSEPSQPSQNERQPVAGRSDPLADALRDHLGSDWIVQRKDMGEVAMRRNEKTPDADLTRKVDDQVHALGDTGRAMTATATGREVTVRGHATDCDVAAKAVDAFAKIDGVDRINVLVDCPLR